MRSRAWRGSEGWSKERLLWGLSALGALWLGLFSPGVGRASPFSEVRSGVASLWSAPAERRGARPAATCQIHVIQGLKVPGPFPKELLELRSRLEVRPFSELRSFKLLRLVSLDLFTRQSSRVHTVGPYWLETELLGQVMSAGRPERLRFILSLERRAEGQRPARNMLRSTLVLDRGGTLFLAGPHHGSGTLVYGVTCK